MKKKICKSKKSFELITEKEVKTIKNLYKVYLINNKLLIDPIEEEETNSIDGSDYEKKNLMILVNLMNL